MKCENCNIAKQLNLGILGYNEKTCITAQELREMGIVIPKIIPDDAWIHKWGVKWVCKHSVRFSDKDDIGEQKSTYFVKIIEPFRWLSYKFLRDTFEMGELDDKA